MLTEIYNVFIIIIQVLSKIIFINKIIPIQPNELYYGNREYKLCLNYSNYSKLGIKNILNKKATQMNFRLLEGSGKAIYFIGLKDNGSNTGISLYNLIISLLFFDRICDISECNYDKIRIYKTKKGYLATIRIYKKIIDFHNLLDI